jgi:uncharacterized protein YgiM (DUF1202 family)
MGALVSLLVAANAGASTAYVSDELVLGVYAEQTSQGQRLATLHSGAGVETLAVNGEFTQVRLNDGTIGWVKSSYLTTQEPAKVRLKHLEEELDRSRATTPALAEAAARSELEQLKRELAAKQSALDAALEAGPPAVRGAAPGSSGTSAKSGATFSGLWIGIPAVLVALACGFWLGYATLAHRIRQKFGGLKVY